VSHVRVNLEHPSAALSGPRISSFVAGRLAVPHLHDHCSIRTRVGVSQSSKSFETGGNPSITAHRMPGSLSIAALSPRGSCEAESHRF